MTTKTGLTPAELSEIRAQAGSKGGRANVKNNGSEHMAEIGRKGAATTWRKYKLVPTGTNGWAMVERETGEVKATHS